MAEGDAGKDAGEGTGKDQPSLELPRLGWRRKPRPESPDRPATPEPTRPTGAPPLFVDEVEGSDEPDEPTRVDEVRPVPTLVTVDEPAPTRVDDQVVEPAPRPRRDPRVRRPGGMVAAVVTGVVVGLGIVGLTWASLRLCEVVQGTSSCGDTGYPLLIAILVVMVVVGALLLKAARVPEAGSTSFLAVGLTSVIALLFLVDSLLDRAMVVVIPVIAAAAFAAAHALTRALVAAPPER